MDGSRRSAPTDASPAAWRRMESRLAAGRAPGCNDLMTLWEVYQAAWEVYQAAVVQGRVRGVHRLPDDLVADLRADHEALVRELRHHR